MAEDFRCSERRRARGMGRPDTCRRCGGGPCTDPEFGTAAPVDPAPAPAPVDAGGPPDEVRQLGLPRVTDELRALLVDVGEYFGDQPARRDPQAGALYRRVMAMLGEQEAE